MESFEINNKNLGKVFDVLKSTIGFDMVSTKPQAEEEYNEYQNRLNEEKKKWEEDHPDLAQELNKFNKKQSSKKSYTPSSSEKETIKKILKMNDTSLDSCEISIMDDGEISVSTCKSSWIALAGREWWINLQNETCKCVAMS